MLRIKKIDEIITLKQSPNGGWGWIVMIAAFFILGNTFGISKSLGIYFLDIKYEFDVTNSATSWISSLFLGAIGMAGLFTSLMSSRVDARMRIMLGGLLACGGLILSAFSPTIWLIYCGCFLAGAGQGIAFVTVTSQVPLYFSTLRPLATGVMLSGSSVCATALPYLNNYFLEKYGWRDSFWILSAICFNTCMLGALVRPIKMLSTKSIAKGDVKGLENSENEKSMRQRISFFLSTYWVALCLLFTNILLDLCFFVPNIFLVPLSQSLGFTSNESALFLSFISVGDIICRPLNGILMSRFKVLINNILLYLATLKLLMCLNQLLAAISSTFSVLIVYTLIHGCLSGFLTTTTVTAVPTLMGMKNLDKIYGVYFAGGSFSLLASAPLAGLFVDVFGDYSAAYWYCVVCFSATGILCLVMYFVVKMRGAVLLEDTSLRLSIDSSGL